MSDHDPSARNDADERLPQLIDATNRLIAGDYEITVSDIPDDELGKLSRNLNRLANVLNRRYREFQQINRFTRQINAGLLLNDILDMVFDEFRQFIPYNRMGFSIIEYDNAGHRILRAHWARTDQPQVRLPIGYSAPLAGSSLEQVIETGQPRIINDLEAYYAAHPTSKSTPLVLQEGIRSSLTCPLIVNHNPVGFMFFSSNQKHTYANAHVETFLQIAGELAITLEKGWLISELSEQQAAIETQNDKLRELNDLKNQFLGIAAHDLHNPLGNIQMIAQLLLQDDFEFEPADYQTFMEDVLKQSTYMLNLLDNLLDVSQIESGKFTLNPKPIPLADFLTELVKRHDRMAEAKGTHVYLDAASGGVISADPLRLRQVLDNLISNAVKYSPPNSEIHIRSTRPDITHWRFEVHDQGPGLSEADHASLFQDFARLSAKPTGGESSHGLGLAITRRIIDAHGGEIGSYNRDNGGAVFWFTLPGKL